MKPAHGDRSEISLHRARFFDMKVDMKQYFKVRFPVALQLLIADIVQKYRHTGGVAGEIKGSSCFYFFSSLSLPRKRFALAIRANAI